MNSKILILLVVILTANFSFAQGWKKYRNILKKEFKGLTPFSIPDINYSPGTVLLIYNKNEQIFSPQVEAFPKLEQLPPSPIPVFGMNKIKKIKFDVNSTTEILPGSISMIANIGLDSKSNYNFEMKNAEKHQVSINSLQTLIHELDINNISDRNLLEELLKDECVIISQGLLVKGLSFTFSRQNDLNSTVKSEIIKIATDADLKLNFINDKKFIIESDTSLYYAFDIYRKNVEELQRLYSDKIKIANLKNKSNDIQSKLDSLAIIVFNSLMALHKITYGNIQSDYSMGFHQNFNYESELEEFRKNDSLIINETNLILLNEYYNSIDSYIDTSYSLDYESSQFLIEYKEAIEDTKDELESALILKNENKEMMIEIENIDSQQYLIFEEGSGFEILESLYNYEKAK